MADKRESITRRGFVAGAGLAAGSVAVAVATSGWAEEAKEESPEVTGGADEGAASPLGAGNDVPASVEVTDYDKVIHGSYQVNMDNVNPFPAIKEPAQYDYDTDALVIGYGAGGTSTALTLTNRGLNVVVMERSLRENWFEHAGVMFCLNFGQKDWVEQIGLPGWNEETIPQFIQSIHKDPIPPRDMQTAVRFWMATPQAVEQIASTEPPATDMCYPLIVPGWAGVPLATPTAAHLTDDPKKIWINKWHVVENAIDRKVQGAGNTVLWGVSATNLIMDEDGRVVGAKGIDTEGNVVYVHAKAVIDCIGGMSANYDMIKFFGGEVEKAYGMNIGYLVDDGAGVRLCWGAGCGFRGTPRCDDFADGALDVIGKGLPWTWIHDQNAVADRIVTSYTYSPICLARQPLLKVNKYGHRFMNEDNGWTEKVKNAYKQPNHRFYTIWDSKIDQIIEDIYLQEDSRWGGCEYPVTPDRYVYYSDDDYRPLPDWHDGVEDGLEKGWILKADTLEELAEKLGINVEAFLETVESYNAMCAAGEDPEFGKDPAYLYPVDEPPYYGAERLAGFPWSICGGVATDADGHVLNDRGEIIPGLYCGANDASLANFETGQFMDDGLAGTGCCFAVTVGYLAGNGAADDIAALEGFPAVTIGHTQTTPAEGPARTFMNANCGICHGVPTKPNFAPASTPEEVEGILTDHMGVNFDEQGVAAITDWVLGE